jgi:hypothetical protein
MVGGEEIPFELWRSGGQRSSLAAAAGARPLGRLTRKPVPKRDALLIGLVCPNITSAKSVIGQSREYDLVKTKVAIAERCTKATP